MQATQVTCVIRDGPTPQNPNEPLEDTNCPLCSNAMIRQTELMRGLEQIEHKFIQNVDINAIARFQHEYYCTQYRDPLRDNNREFVNVTIRDMRKHFSTHRVSQTRLILADVAQARQAQHTVLNGADFGTDARMKTWITLSKHKHDLLRLLRRDGTTSTDSRGESFNGSRLHAV